MGIVVGATHPFDLEKVRKLTSSLHILIPGFGAQGGKLEEILPICGNLSLINSSRSILFASSGDDFATKAKLACSTIHSEIYRIMGIN
jgi:orotidine-5'-phosphate decarboxylase